MVVWRFAPHLQAFQHLTKIIAEDFLNLLLAIFIFFISQIFAIFFCLKTEV